MQGLKAKSNNGKIVYKNNGKIRNLHIDESIEKNYFHDNQLFNGDFSEGLIHWASTVEATGYYPQQEADNIFEICTEEFLSYPASLKITANKYPCRLLYVKEKNKQFCWIKDAWSYDKSKAFLGVYPGAKISVSLFYKGSAGPTVKLMILHDFGGYSELAKCIMAKPSSTWENITLDAVVPNEGRALLFEIQVTSLKPVQTMYLDDIRLRVEGVGNGAKGL